MPYAAAGRISTSPIPGGVAITDAQYQEALAGIAQGQIITVESGFAVIDKPPPPEPEPEPEPTPEEALAAERAGMVVSRFQAKAAMTDAGILAAAESAVSAADARTQLAWAEAVEFRRNSPAITSLAAGIGLSPTEIDDLFRAAMEIEA